MNTAEKYRVLSDCLVEDMDGELLVYNPTTATTLHLNGSSAVVWGLCDGQNSIDAMIELISDAYPDQADQIAGDVTDVIKRLLQSNVIELVVN